MSDTSTSTSVDALAAEFIRKYAVVEGLRSYVRSGDAPESDVASVFGPSQLEVVRQPQGRDEIDYWLNAFKRTFANLDLVAASSGSEALGPVEWQKSNDAIDRALGSLAARLTALANGAPRITL